MKGLVKLFSFLTLISFISCVKTRDMNEIGVVDTPYLAPYAVKYSVPDKWKGAEMKKLVIDDDDNVFALTSMGVFRDFPDQKFSKDLMYSSLADKMPVDITVQDSKGYLYYLYPDRYLSNRDAGKICGHLPKEYKLIAVSSSGKVLLAGGSDSAIYADNKKVRDLAIPQEGVSKIYSCGDNFYCLTGKALYSLNGNSWKPVYSMEGMTSIAFVDEGIVIGTGNGFLKIDPEGNVKEELTDRVPIPSITDLQVVDGKLWFASTDGVYMKGDDGFRYYGRGRWLDEQGVIDIASDSSGDIYMLTPSGLSKIDFREETLACKADYLLTHLRKYHMRFGFSEESALVDISDPTSIVLKDSDNDGLWSSFYLGTEAFRYAVTKDPRAKENAWETFASFERLISIHEPQWFSSRSFERTGYHVHNLYAWRPSPDPDWEWKGTTSTDEFVGYLFVACVLHDYVAETPEEKARVAKYMSTLMDHIIENNYYFIDVDGEPTLWGRLNPEYVNSFSHTQFDRMLNSILTLASFQEAYAMTGDEKYKDQVLKAINEFGYLENIESGINNIKYTPGFRHKGIALGEDWNHSDDEMAFLTYWVLCRYALDDNLKEKYQKHVLDHWQIERPEGDALWNLITYKTCGKMDLDKTMKYLREFPIDCTRYEVMNSQRHDLDFIPYDVHTNFRAQFTKELLPKNERPVQRHNSNEFKLDSAEKAGIQLAGDEYLLPYWMARYLGVVK